MMGMDPATAISTQKEILELMQDLEEYAIELYGDGGDDALAHLRKATLEIRAAGRALRAAEVEQ